MITESSGVYAYLSNWRLLHSIRHVDDATLKLMCLSSPSYAAKERRYQIAQTKSGGKRWPVGKCIGECAAKRSFE